MCCFSGPVRVGFTKIFARATAPERQAIVYGMTLSTSDDVAMILPLPTAPSAGEHALRFIDLSGYPDIFEHLKAVFPPIPLRLPITPGKGGAAPSLRKPLPVHEVGAFEASFVPAPGDFERLDPRFRMPSVVWRALPRYESYGFAVFKLRKTHADVGKGSRVHPMAFEFVRKDQGRLFFPTVHVHHGEVVSRAYFDHELYCQMPGAPPRAQFDDTPWIAQAKPIASSVDLSKACGLVAADEPAYMAVMDGLYPNQDVWSDGATD